MRNDLHFLQDVEYAVFKGWVLYIFHCINILLGYTWKYY